MASWSTFIFKSVVAYKINLTLKEKEDKQNPLKLEKRNPINISFGFKFINIYIESR